MATKDWEVLRNSTDIILWQNKKTLKTLFIESNNSRVYWYVGINNVRRYTEANKDDALKHAKAYMRKN